MDDAKKIIDEAEREGLQMSQGLLRLVLKMWEGAREDVQAATAAAKRLRVVSIIAILISAVCLCVCVYQGTVIHRQGGEIAAIHRILEEGVVIEETTTTTETTTTVEQDTGEGSGNNVYQAGDNSSYNQTGGGE